MAQHQPIRRTPPSAGSEIPDKLYFRIGEVSKLCDLPAYVLRFWEGEFPSLKPHKGGTGQRLYRRRDVEMSRDQGITDVICRPMSPKTVTDKLRAALRAPRPFIAAPEFFGPDRRAKDRSWRGEDRRAITPRKTKVHFDHD